ncbi:sec-independent protein translocase protein TatA [Saccharopolyspora gloriosae]|uniref:Sec-independent protein translocase protein TatA n=1 Tax=Saccharopolyspora gloriosae TaxID=455344 RepID=A0A840NCH7_9PSEU|nr:sec-independent protein translocase protein TatA [Saccharopolyspora gloriosae]
MGVLVLLFGATKLPQMARSLGQSARVFKAEARGMKEDEAAAKRDKDSASEPQQLTTGEASAPVTASNAEEAQRKETKN